MMGMEVIKNRMRGRDRVRGNRVREGGDRVREGVEIG